LFQNTVGSAELPIGTSTAARGSGTIANAMNESSRPSIAPPGWHADGEQPGQLRYWDGTTWTEHRVPAPTQVRRPRRRWLITIAAVVVSVGLLVAAVSLYAWAQSDLAIARIRGNVISVQDVHDDSIEVCVESVTDAGTNYGKHPDEAWKSPQCWAGTLDGITPVVGQCVVLQAVGESSELTVEPAVGCK
jgi:hypothetical protein